MQKTAGIGTPEPPDGTFMRGNWDHAYTLRIGGGNWDIYRLSQLRHPIIIRNQLLKKVDKAGKTPWWNSQIESRRKKVRKLLNEAKRTKQPIHWGEYESAKREYRKSIWNAQRDSW
ncbi:hypothetical protein JTB14_038115 [Gonioctena quinquepunctata]|nr:hypothetical protein JTB14_038115 [Gonioctena quinquepunctata]